MITVSRQNVKLLAIGGNNDIATGVALNTF